MILVQHLLALALLVAVPIWDRTCTRRLKRGGRNARRRAYAEIIAVLWALAAVAAVAVGPRVVWATPVRPGTAGVPAVGNAGPALVGIIGGLAAGLLVPVVLVRVSPKVRATMVRRLDPLAFMLPATGADRWWFAAVSVTAGVCEEVVYRGFLIRYLHAGPWTLSPLVAVVIAAGLFGLAHLYQGASGVALTAVLAVVLSAVFVVTGSLAVPMAVHAAIDLRLLLLWPAATTDVPPSAPPGP